MYLDAPSHVQQPAYLQTTSQQSAAQHQRNQSTQAPLSPPATLSPDTQYRQNTSPPASYHHQMDNRGSDYSRQPATAGTHAGGTGTDHLISAQSPSYPPPQYHQMDNRKSEYPQQPTPTGSYAGGTGPSHSIPAPSPTYPQPQYASYAGGEMSHPAYNHPGHIYSPTRPDWANYSQASPLTPHVYSQPASAPARPPGQVYSFVPIPGATQHKRPRRRYEEIERMYKCGWNGCEKAYGTLNHLNAHVTMQSHGQKRTPEEFKEIRKEWKARKKEQEQQQKAKEQQQQQAAQQAVQQAAQNGSSDAQPPADPTHPPTTYAQSTSVQLPPIGYGNTYAAGPATTVPQQPLPEQYNASQLYPGHHHYSPQPPSPFPPQQHQGMYNQR